MATTQRPLPTLIPRESRPPSYYSVLPEPNDGQRPPPYTLFDFEDASLAGSPTARERISAAFGRALPNIGLILSLLVGAGITAGTTYALALRVEHQVNNARVDSDPQVWMQKARNVYDRCYNGCGDVDDSRCTWDNCEQTRSISLVTNETTVGSCDANKMWNWAAPARYPDPCLRGLGEQIRHNALEELKGGLRAQWAIIILTLLGGLLGGLLVWKLWKKMMAKWRRRAQQKLAQRQNEARRHFGHQHAASRRAGTARKGARVGRARTVFTAGLALLGMSKGAAAGDTYSCQGLAPKHELFFTNANGTIHGFVHGWLSKCRTEEKCTNLPYYSCTSPTGCYVTWTSSCSSEVVVDKTPEYFVWEAFQAFYRCGFHVTSTPSPDSRRMRVAHPGIEKNLWVQISVNGFNVTSKTETDEEILCLHEIGNR